MCPIDGVPGDFETLLFSAAEDFLGSGIRYTDRLDGGDEAHVFRAETDIGRIVLHASPPWRTRGELEWVHALASHSRIEVPVVVCPIERGGRTLFECGGRLVAVFPFIQGRFLDRSDPALREDAATLLARVHNALLDFRAGPRPRSADSRPAPPKELEALHDLALDYWWQANKTRRWVIGPTHGDYYRNNLICDGGRIKGIIDWHEAKVRHLALELAQATFELCHDSEHNLQLDQAEEFVSAYRRAKGPVLRHKPSWLIPLMRIWLREDVLGSLADGCTISNVYVAKQIQAFRRLAAVSPSSARLS